MAMQMLTYKKDIINLALHKHAWLQHRFTYAWRADLAVDGRRSDLSAGGTQCAISSGKKPTAEWWVDLGGVVNIHHIFIQYRTGNRKWVFISNTTNKEDGILCFKDTNYTKATIPNPTNIACPYHGRYVIYLNNRTHLPYPAGYSPNAHIELCEVEVYGCPRSGYYGGDCSSLCPRNCEGDECDIVNGTCKYCEDGFEGPQCNKECAYKKYGPFCSKNCGFCLNTAQCHHVSGECLNGCDKGYQGLDCKTECPIGTYGYNCKKRCSVKCGIPENCDRITGHCANGCQAGWKDKQCETKCNDTHYGQDCNHTCGHCWDHTQCHHVNGSCLGGCEEGFIGDKCMKDLRPTSFCHGKDEENIALYSVKFLLVLSFLCNFGV
uniref:Multiple epidermal growth factor-like domains protein 10 n=1 Tax=Crassostrea virginica TaxID=6565 RepID=A0A8B8AGX1_CRAVI|nr:multiple epidermal growth factor-like domains protein 10 [Crassostrea virginica]